MAVTPRISSVSILNNVKMDSENSGAGYGVSLILFDIGMRIGIVVFGIIKIKKKFRTLSF